MLQENLFLHVFLKIWALQREKEWPFLIIHVVVLWNALRPMTENCFVNIELIIICAVFLFWILVWCVLLASYRDFTNIWILVCYEKHFCSEDLLSNCSASKDFWSYFWLVKVCFLKFLQFCFHFSSKKWKQLK